MRITHATGDPAGDASPVGTVCVARDDAPAPGKLAREFVGRRHARDGEHDCPCDCRRIVGVHGAIERERLPTQITLGHLGVDFPEVGWIWYELDELSEADLATVHRVSAESAGRPS